MKEGETRGRKGRDEKRRGKTRKRGERRRRKGKDEEKRGRAKEKNR